LLGAAAASGGLMRVWAVFLVAAAGNLTADTLWYLLGYYGKVETILRVGRVVKLQQKHLDRLTVALQKHALKVLFFAKLTAGFMIPSLIATGLAHIPWKRWFPVLLLGETIWTGTLILIGYYTTETIKIVARDIRALGLVASMLFLGFLLWEGRRRLLKTRRIRDTLLVETENNKQDAHPDH
jgi:membrane-associated protein